MGRPEREEIRDAIQRHRGPGNRPNRQRGDLVCLCGTGGRGFTGGRGDIWSRRHHAATASHPTTRGAPDHTDPGSVATHAAPAHGDPPGRPRPVRLPGGERCGRGRLQPSRGYAFSRIGLPGCFGFLVAPPRARNPARGASLPGPGRHGPRGLGGDLPPARPLSGRQRLHRMGTAAAGFADRCLVPEPAESLRRGVALLGFARRGHGSRARGVRHQRPAGEPPVPGPSRLGNDRVVVEWPARGRLPGAVGHLLLPALDAGPGHLAPVDSHAEVMAPDSWGVTPGGHPDARIEERATDAALVARATAGDGGAFTALVLRHHAACLRYASHLLGDRMEAEDVVQETLWRAYRSLGRYE